MKSYEEFPEAFDYCRECDRPVVVIVGKEKWKFYPSGGAKFLSYVEDRAGDVGAVAPIPGRS